MKPKLLKRNLRAGSVNINKLLGLISETDNGYRIDLAVLIERNQIGTIILAIAMLKKTQ